MKRLFGTFGVRRTANDVLTPEFASRLAASYGSIVQGKVAIGGDTRTTTPMIKHAIAAGLLSSGCDVIDLGILPTPAVQYAVRNYYDGGIIVTASHNPPKYNGLKFVDEYGIGLKDEDELAIEEMYFDDEPKRNTWDSIGNYYKNDTIIEEYIEEILKRIDVDSIQKAKLKVVLDCGSGAGCFTSPYLMQKLGCELITLNSQADGFFPGRNPEPTEPNLKELIATVKDLKADIGIAHDGDADRTICIDEKGNFVLGDKTFSLVEKQMLKDSKEENKEEKLENREEKKENKKEKLENKEVKLNNKNKNSKNLIVTTVATSQAIYDIAKEYGGEVIATAVGDLLVARKLMEEDGLFGGEENGGLIFPDFVYGRDAALSAAKILEILAKEKKPLSEVVEELPVYYSEKLKCECEDDKKSEVMNNIATEVSSLGYELDITDGVKIFKDGGWVIIRPSGTEPIFRCFSECDSQKTATEMAKWGISLIEKYKNK